jgi:spore coat protein U-like protein
MNDRGPKNSYLGSFPVRATDAPGQSNGVQGQVRIRQGFKLRYMKPIKKLSSEKTMKWCMAVLLVLGVLPWAGVSAREAETKISTTVLRVSARVEESCEVTAPDLPLVNYTARRDAPRQSWTLLHATCTPNTTYALRRIEPGAQVRQPYSEPLRSAVSDMVIGVGTGFEVDHTVFGGVPGTQLVPAGDHADTVTLRVYY